MVYFDLCLQHFEGLTVEMTNESLEVEPEFILRFERVYVITYATCIQYMYALPSNFLCAADLDMKVDNLDPWVGWVLALHEGFKNAQNLGLRFFQLCVSPQLVEPFDLLEVYVDVGTEFRRIMEGELSKVALERVIGDLPGIRIPRRVKFLFDCKTQCLTVIFNPL